MLLRIALHGTERAILLLWSAIRNDDVSSGATILHDLLGGPAGKPSLEQSLLLILRIRWRRAVRRGAARSLPGQLLGVGSVLALAS